MEGQSRLPHYVGIPHHAFTSVILGMMLFSFPMGAFVVFHTDVGQEINFEVPLGQLGGYRGIDLGPLSAVELGDAFLAAWSIYAVLFAVAMLGPGAGFVGTVSSELFRAGAAAGQNYMVSAIRWFSILVLASAAINFVQEGFGVSILPPDVGNDLEMFFYVSISPLVEEVAFRVLLVGLPAFALCGSRLSAGLLLRSLWHPARALRAGGSKRVAAVIVLVGVMFGLAHVMTGDPWSEGKFAQASAAGIILGWVYFRFGFVAALLIHWATNYFVFAYVNFVAQASEMAVGAAFSHSLVATMEVLLLLSGILSLAAVAVGRLRRRREGGLEF